MGILFNPLSGNFDITGAASGAATWTTSTATEAGLSVVGNTDGDVKVTLDTDYIWVWDGTTSRWINQGIKAANIGSTPGASGYSLGYSNVASNRRELQLTLQPADATYGGILSTTTQTIAGAKTFNEHVNLASGKFLKYNTATVLYTDASLNAFVGPSGNATVSGTANMALGSQALAAVTSGINNVAIGALSLLSLQGGSRNIGIGFGALALNVSSGANTAIGESALTVTTAAENTAIGYSALVQDTTGQHNTAVGAYAGWNILSGSENVAIGRLAGYSASPALTTVANCTFIGTESTATSNGLTNTTALGYQAAATASNQMMFGNSSVTSNVFHGTLTVDNLDKDSAGTLTIGGVNATTINIGRSGATVNIIGSTQYSQVTNLQVTDLLITLNKGGGAASAAASGLELEENSVITAYIKTSADRNSYELLAPNTAGVVTVTPGAGGFTIDQGSHNPVTIGTANGLSLSTQALSMALATGSVTGTVSAVTQTFGGGKTIDGNSDEVQLTILGHSTQTNNLIQVYTSGFTSLLTLNNSGNFAVGGNITSGAGLKISAGYFEGHNAAQATTGIYRLDNLNSIAWRNNANNGNMELSVDGSDRLAYTGTTIFGQVIDSGLTANTVIYANASKQLTSSSVSDTTLGYLDATSSIQTQLDARLLESAGDINETSFTAADNQVAAANVTGLAFANGTVRSFEAIVSIVRASTYQQFILNGIQKGASWELGQSSLGDDCGLTFTLTSAGQVQYVSTSTGSTATVKFRALTTTV